MMMNKHKFKLNARVKVLLFDFADGALKQFSVPGKVTNQSEYPYGYIVKLDNPVDFYGHIPSMTIYGIEDNRNHSVTLQQIFCRESLLSQHDKRLRNRLLEIGEAIIFCKIYTVVVKPTGAIDYINYYNEAGTVETLLSSSKLGERTEHQDRIAYKVPHFFGFTKKVSGIAPEPTELHFSSHRYTTINFWEGFKWEYQESEITPFLPRNGEQICGISSTVKTNKAPSFDRWFVCSYQFKMLWMLLKADVWPDKFKEYTDAEFIELLVIPENEEHLYIPHEVPFSRYLYAAIFLLAVRDAETLPAEWNLPKRKLPDREEMEPFEVWWPRKVLEE